MNGGGWTPHNCQFALRSLRSLAIHSAEVNIADDRTYTDEEFTLILRKATELAEPANRSGRSARADPGRDEGGSGAGWNRSSLVERAARLLKADRAAAPSILE